ncbi:MAG TPA: type II CAAX endopeptidase family protein [Candidatus Acidoferrales bacterium]
MMDTFESAPPPDGTNPPPETPPLPAAPVQPPGLNLLKYPEDLRVRWGWLDIFVFVLVSIAAYFISAIVLIIAFMAKGTNVQQLQHSPRALALFFILNTVMASLVQLGFLYLRTRVLSGEPFWRGLGWWSFDSLKLDPRRVVAYCVLTGIVLSALVDEMSNYVGHKGQLPIEVYFQDRRSVFLLMVLAITLAPLVEEMIFRGYIYPVVARSLGIPTGVILTGILFGLLHAPQLSGAWAQIGLLVVVGIVFTYIRAASRTVLASYITHLSYNGYIFISTMIQTHGLRNLPFTH